MLKEIYGMLYTIAINKQELPILIHHEDGSIDIEGSVDKKSLEYYTDLEYPAFVSNFLFGISHPHVHFEYRILDEVILLRFRMILINDENLEYTNIVKAISFKEFRESDELLEYQLQKQINERIKHILPVYQH